MSLLNAVWLTGDVPLVDAVTPVTTAGSLFELLRDGAPRTRAELARTIGVSRTTVTLWVDQLMNLQLVVPVDRAVSTGGRPSSQFAFRPESGTVVAVDIGASATRIGLTDLSGEVIRERTELLDVSEGPESELRSIERVVGELCVESGRDASAITAVGIGIPGPVEYATGRPINPPIMPGWDRYDVKAWGESTFDAPTIVDNDVNAMAVGESSHAWPGIADVVFVKVATGIGAGVISGGSLRRGASGAAGDIGHAPVARRPDAVCPCGNRGCLEAVASGRAIAQDLRDKGLDAASARDVVGLVKAGNVEAIHAVRQAGRDIGEVLTVCVSLLNPSVIVIGGSLAQAAEHLVAGVREVVYARSIPLLTEQLTIAPSRTGSHAGLRGISRLAVDSALSAERIDRLLARS